MIGSSNTQSLPRKPDKNIFTTSVLQVFGGGRLFSSKGGKRIDPAQQACRQSRPISSNVQVFKQFAIIFRAKEKPDQLNVVYQQLSVQF